MLQWFGLYPEVQLRVQVDGRQFNLFAVKSVRGLRERERERRGRESAQRVIVARAAKQLLDQEEKRREKEEGKTRGKTESSGGCGVFIVAVVPVVLAIEGAFRSRHFRRQDATK